MIKKLLKMQWWRLRTRARLLRPSVRAEWREQFSANPSLHSARHYADLSAMAHMTMAGFYNENTPGGFMTPQQASKLYKETAKC